MAFTDIAPPPAPKAAGTGISFSLTINKAGQTKVRITMRDEIQVQLFGASIVGKTFSAQIGRGKDEGLLRLVLDPTGDLEARESMKGSAFIFMAGWDLLPKSKRPAAACTIEQQPSNVEAILKLPPFCKPSGVSGKMEEQFGLKKIQGGKTAR